jgi:proteasome accessory factor A
MLQGEEIEFAFSPKDPTNLSKSFADDLLKQLVTADARQICGCDLVLPACKAKEDHTYFLTNGSKAYVDEIQRQEGGKYRIFEIATPEVESSLDVVLYDKTAEKIARMSAQILNARHNLSVECYKTSIATGIAGDGYTTRGAHESYRVTRALIDKIDTLVPFLALRQLLCGSGGYYKHRPVISPRQFFVERTVSEVTVPVPMVCLRSESLSGNKDYFRLQVLNGDPTRSQISTFLRFAITSLVIQCIQEGFINNVPELENPVEAARMISEKCSAQPTVRLTDGRLMKANDYLEHFYLRPIERYAKEIGLSQEMNLASEMFKDLLIELGADRLEGLHRRVEWVIKLDLFEWNFENFFDLETDIAFPKETANNAYCAVTDPIFDELERELGIAQLFGEKEIITAIVSPPPLSRGKARYEILKHFNGAVDEINWDYVTVRGSKFPLSEDIKWDSETIANTIKEIQERTYKA